MAQVLLTVSGTIDPAIKEKIAAGERPCADYIAMAEAFDADLIDYTTASASLGIVGRIFERIGSSNLILAWACFQRRNGYRAIFTDGEQVGIPLAFLLKIFGRGKQNARHLMIVHILSVRKKLFFFNVFKIQTHIDRFLVYSTWQRRFIEQKLNVPSDRVEFTSFMVDTHFFSSQKAQSAHSNDRITIVYPSICSVGLEYRDYPTLIAAIRELNVQVIIAAASPWSKRTDSTRGQLIPDNVLVREFTQYELRQVYAKCNFVVIPLENVNFQAGVTAILEAMAMEKAVICTLVPGQTDVVREGETGLYVPPGDPLALRKAIERLLENPEEARLMGKKGRQLIEKQMSLSLYTERLTHSIQAALEASVVTTTDNSFGLAKDHSIE